MMKYILIIFFILFRFRAI